MNIDITSTPFSRYGEFISISASVDEAVPCLIIRNVRAMKSASKLLAVRFLKDGAAQSFTIHADAHVLKISSPAGSARLYIRSSDAVVVETEHLDVEVKPFCACLAFLEGERRFKFHMDGIYVPFAILIGSPTLHMDRYIHEDGIQRISDVSISVKATGGKALVHCALQLREKSLPDIDPDQDIAQAQAEWLAFRSKMMPVPKEREQMAELAWYNIWSAFVRLEGYIKYDACLMSKATMCAIWSWDHCFNALAVAHASPALGLEQWLLPFELQSEDGQLPDRWSTHVATWLVTKPPVHGWCLSKLLKLLPEQSPQMLRKLYRHLEKWTQFWFTLRDTDGDGIPNYVWGLDSGWDNATLFDAGFGVETPDLSAFLVLQMDALADLATRLGDTAGACAWKERADMLLIRLYEHCWKNDRFVAPTGLSHFFDAAPTSLLALMPLVLGQRLDPSKRSQLVEHLKRDFLTPIGLATEAPASPLYLDDGYWRGPIWAPSTYLLVDGLARAGETELAHTIAGRFCNMVAKAGGHYENYDALTGKGLCDQGYTWTASVHLLLLNEYLLRE